MAGVWLRARMHLCGFCGLASGQAPRIGGLCEPLLGVALVVLLELSCCYESCGTGDVEVMGFGLGASPTDAPGPGHPCWLAAGYGSSRGFASGMGEAEMIDCGQILRNW